MSAKKGSKKKKKDKLTSLLLIFILMAGLSLLLYPKFADYWNSLHQSRAIAAYSDAVVAIDNSATEALLEAAREYNSHIPSRINSFVMTEEEEAAYPGILDVTGTGIMGYVEIPDIKVELPVYHGTSEGVLQIAAGHLEWTSFPVGGKGTQRYFRPQRFAQRQAFLRS